MPAAKEIKAALEERFGEKLRVNPALTGLDGLARIAGRSTHRRYSDRPLDEHLLRLICACALSAPSKSDLQQRDIVIVRDTELRAEIAALIPDMPWIAAAPAFLVFCANGRRLPEISKLREKPFPNDHFDLLFNAIGDAAIALATCINAAESIGLGCCAISVIRDHAARVSELLKLPARVIPFAGLCIGWPSEDGRVVPRLPLAMTVHVDRYDDAEFVSQLDAYDHRRETLRPYANQRAVGRWGRAPRYGWSEDKARQYAEPQRTDFGAFVRAQGFSME
jgi:nitroreductase/FMN reductase [NAD(P)H]